MSKAGKDLGTSILSYEELYMSMGVPIAKYVGDALERTSFPKKVSFSAANIVLQCKSRIYLSLSFSSLYEAETSKRWWECGLGLQLFGRVLD